MAGLLEQELDDCEVELELHASSAPALPQSSPPPSHRGRAKGKGRGGRARGSHGAADEDHTSTAETDSERRCSFCKRSKSFDDFHMNSAQRRDCRSKIEACERRFAKANKSNVIEETKRNSPKEYERVVRAFDNASPKGTARHNRRSATINVLTLVSQALDDWQSASSQDEDDVGAGVLRGSRQDLRGQPDAGGVGSAMDAVEGQSRLAT